MNNVLSQNVWDILICPHCGNNLSASSEGAKCSNCLEEYGYSNEGQLDLRLSKQKVYQIDHELGTELFSGIVPDFGILKENGTPEVNFTNIKVPWHFTKELLSYIPKAREKNSLVLDIGCGNGLHKEICEHAGFEFVGFDYDDPDAPMLADGHALPFKNESFELVILMNVLEHIRYPFVMMKEINRVLKNGGKFIGAVSFLEPFHMNSFYHHTHLGTYNSIQMGGFEIEHVSPNLHWHSLYALAYMEGLFPKLPRFVAKSLVMPLYLLHRFWWKIGNLISSSDSSSEKFRLIRTGGSFLFIASKPKK